MDHNWKLIIPVSTTVKIYVCLNCGLYKGDVDNYIFWWMNHGINKS